jgi:hypothetical protein
MTQTRTSLLAASTVVALLLLLFTRPHAALACICHRETREEQVAAATQIFRGRVVALEQNERWDFATLSVTFDVSTVWKGPRAATLMVYSSGRDESFCGYPFEVGEDYIVYATVIWERDGAWLPYTSHCHLTQSYNVEEAARLGVGTFVGPTPAPRPTLPICPARTSTPTSRALPSTTPLLSHRIWLPVSNRVATTTATTESARDPAGTPPPCVSLTPPPTASPTPDYATPPYAILTLPDSHVSNEGSIGSYSWWITGASHTAPGIATGRRPAHVRRPFRAQFVLPPEAAPNRLELSIGRVTVEDKIPGIEGRDEYWAPKEMLARDIPVARAVEVVLNIDPGLYVIRLVAQWGTDAAVPGALGWAEYGWLIEVMAQRANSGVHAPRHGEQGFRHAEQGQS